MKRFLRVSVLFLVAVAAGVPVPAGDAGERVEVSGWITCEYCGKANANSAGAACVRACAKKGAKLMLFSDDRLFRLEQQELAREHIGHEVVVVGSVADGNVLHLERIEKKKTTKKGPAPGV